jgi:hypothetical protein
MTRPALAALASAIVLAAVACQSQDPSAPADGNDGGKPSFASTSCRYSPSGTVEIVVGQAKSFIQSAGDCTGAYGVLSPTDGRVEFGIGPAPCTAFTATAADNTLHTLKVFRCAIGNATFNIYTNSSKTTLLQTITITYN